MSELLPCQQAIAILFTLLPDKANGTMGIFLKTFKAQSSTIHKALEKDKKLQAELDSLFIKARDELNAIYPVEVKH